MWLLLLMITDTGTHMSEEIYFRVGNVITMSKRIKKGKNFISTIDQ